jgi:mycothiol synthase
MTAWNPEVVLCPPEQWRAALGLLYRRMPGALRPRMIDEALQEVQRGEIDLSGLWVARRGRWVIGALLTQPLAGRVAALWAPEVDAIWHRAETVVALVHAALDDLRRRGYLLAQALLDESAPRHAAADLTAAGLVHVTDLVYLEIETAPLPLRPDTPVIEWRPFRPDTETDFHAVIQKTYIDSLDMPELEGLRSLDDVLAGHRAAGRFVPERWRVGHVRGEPGAAAVVLLAEVVDRDTWEVVYLGLTPSARGRGLGRASLAYAVDLARPFVPRLELALDMRNVPARRLYHNVGLRPFDRRAVYIAALR